MAALVSLIVSHFATVPVTRAPGQAPSTGTMADRTTLGRRSPRQRPGGVWQALSPFGFMGWGILEAWTQAGIPPAAWSRPWTCIT
jgi:hypothetical protein